MCASADEVHGLMGQGALDRERARASDTDGQWNGKIAGAGIHVLASERERIGSELEHRSNLRIFAECRIALQLLEDAFALARSRAE